MAPRERTAIRAIVHARLLGLRLLSLDAEIVIGPVATADRLVPPLSERERSQITRRTRAVKPPPASLPARDRADRPAGLAEASELLAASSSALAELRRGSRDRPGGEWRDSR